MVKVRVVEGSEHDLDAIKGQVDLRLVVTPGAPIRGAKPTKIPCFWHKEKDPSLNVYPDHLFCYGCRTRMDLFDFVAWQKGIDSHTEFDRLLDVIEEEYVGSVTPPPAHKPKKPLEPIPGNVAEYYHGRLGERREWFRGRGLTDETIDRELLGYDVRAFVIPVLSGSGELLTLRFRRDDNAYESAEERDSHSKYWGLPGRNDVWLYNAKALALAKDWGFVVICEGELDALRLYQEGLPAVSATNGAGGFHEGFVPAVRSMAPDRVVVAYDQDEQGRIHGIRVARMFGLKGRIARWPREWGKDVTEFLKTRTIEEMVERFLDADRPSRVERYWQQTLRNGVWR